MVLSEEGGQVVVATSLTITLWVEEDEGEEEAGGTTITPPRLSH